ncbi:MAG: carboxypeptidase-like regulatory domain-containing protein [Desulfuromonadaceae bacterium]|nr:carboxypeptidase-like regulatory domain-containing protein [Desulfuromonadaceae bacterium]
MFKRSLLIICAALYLFIFAPLAHAQLPQMTSGLSYLTSSQNPDGTWDTGTSQAETTAATISVLETLKLLNQTAGAPYTSGVSWLQAQSPLSVDYIAQRLHALGLADVNTLIPSADMTKGGWGGDSGYETNPLDTSHALQTLKSANYTDLTTINAALAYLTGNQKPDGGWGFTQGDDSNVYITAIVSATLQQFPQMTALATAVNKATTYLLAQQIADGGFGSVYETALAYSALVAVSTNNAALTNAVNYLTTTQSANGSWNDDPYSTALALKALYLSENKPSPPPPPPAGGKITGTVIDKITGQKVAGVAVVLDSSNLINGSTDSSGSFTLSDIPAGSQKVNFSLTGYAATNATATVVVDTTASLGIIPMTSAATTGTIAGTITDSTGKPLTGVAITITGAWSGNATTGTDGTYSFSYVTPGTVTISAAKTGFQTVTATGSVYARTTLTFSPRMSTTASQATTGILVGRVVDSYWGVPIGHLPEEKGVRVIVPGLAEVPVEPEGGGYFTIPNLTPGTYQVIVGMLGFQTFRVVITPGGVTDLGTIRLEMSTEMTLTGKITDASTSAPIPGAEVTFQGKDFTGRADASGTYAIADIPSHEQFTIKFSADGYVGKSFTMGSSAWLQTMDITLSKKVTTGSLTGSVIDAATSLPLAGVTLILISDSAISATTDNNGTFILNTLPPGPQRTSLALDGYTARTMTTVITVGTVGNVGKLPLDVTELPATIQGTAQKVGAATPFAGVTIRTTGTDPLQTVTAADGTYVLDSVPPGIVTVTANALSDPGFSNARFTETLEPGGILVFSPALSMMLPGTFDLTAKADKAIYGLGDTVSIAVNLRNRQAEEIVAALHVLVTDPIGANVYETSANVTIDADGAIDQPQSFILPTTAKSGRYMVLTEVFDATGAMLGNSYKYFDVTVSQIAVTPVLPAAFAAGDNTLAFNLVNSGTLAVSAGTFSVTLKDPDGQIVSTATQSFSLVLGENKTIATSLSIPALKFGTYTLSYVQSDETKPGQATDIALPNSLASSALYDDASHRIRGTASLTVTVRNTGRFDLGSASVMAAMPDATYSETKTLTALAVGNSSALLYQFTIPETMTAGQHGTRITISLPSGSTTAQTAQLAIMESSLSLSPLQTTFTAGETINPLIANSGGVDTPVHYRLSLYDAKAALIVEATGTETATAGASLSLALAIPAGAVDGSYNLVATYKDTKTGKEATVPNGITINGVKGTLQVQTDKQNYLLTENISGTSSTTSSGTPLTGGNLHLKVTTGPGAQKTKTWTTQADFQNGVRNGVDTYGVNDWIIPDDDFDGAAIDPNKWGIGGTVSIQAGRLFLDTTQAPVTSIVTSKWLLESDFDIQVDFTSNNSTSWTGAGINVSFSNSAAGIGNNTAAGYASQFTIDGVQQSNVTNGVSSNSGKFRITRAGNVVVVYYWGGSSWIEFNRGTSSALTSPCSVSMGIYRDTNLPGATAAFDNFKVNSGRIVTKNETVDSVRLLPLNDNFDDGMLNEDRWTVTSGSKPTEDSGLIHLTSTSASPSNYLTYRAPLSGDFNAVSVFKNYGATPTKSPQGRYIMDVSAENSSIYINRQSHDLSRAGGEFVVSLSQINGAYLMSGDLPYASDSGQFRLRREGNTAFSDYWNGSQWNTQHSRSGFPTSPGGISLYTLSQDNIPMIKVDLDRFYTNKGTYTGNGTITLKFDSGAPGSQWGKLLHSSTQPVGTSIKFRTRTAEAEAGLANSTWSDYLTASGSAVTSPAARWIEIESTLATSDTNVTPLLHDVSVTYESDPGEILWQTDVPATLTQSVANQLNHTIGTLGMTGKFYLEGTLTSSTGQTVASAVYPFYVEQGNIQMTLTPDKKIYRPGEAVTITGEAKNLSSIAATGLTSRVQGTGVATPSSEAFDLSANSAHPFSLTTTAGNDGIYQLTGSVTQNSISLADIADQYEVASPVLTATLSAPDTVANVPFTVSITLTNNGKVDATATVHIVDDSGNVIGDQAVTVPVGESRILQYTRQISGATTYTATMSGDLNLTLTKTVDYTVLAADSSVNGTIVTDKASYNPNEQVTLTATVSAASTRENLSTLIIVTNSQGQAVHSATAAIPALVQSQIVTNKNYWNSGTYPAGTYLITLQILDPSGSVVVKKTCNLMINSPTTPAALLKGTITLDKQSILTGEPVSVSYRVTNTGNVDLVNVPLSIKTVNMAEQTVYNTISDQATLAMGATATNSGNIDTTNYSAKDYLVVLRATINGVEETLAGSYFRVEGAPSAPVLISPANCSDVDTLTPVLMLSNAADPNDDKLSYEFEIFSDIGLTNLVISVTIPETTGATSWSVPAPLTENQSYFWRVRAYDGRLYSLWMPQASFRVNTVNDPPTAPTVSSPAEGTSVALMFPVLTATNATDPDSTDLTYNFAVALDPEFTRIVASTIGVAGGQGTTSWTVPVNLQENGWYYWRSQADDWLTEGPWSTTARFLVNTANNAPTAPVVISPVNGTTVTALATDVTVTNSTDPDSTSLLYYIEVDTAPTFDSTGIIRSGAVTEGQATTLWHLSGLADNTPYYLRVKSSDGSADSPWSAVSEFVVNTVNDPPATPILANPSNGAGVSLFTPTLSVHNSTDLDKDILTYEFEIYTDAALTNLVSQSGSVAETASVTGWTVPVALAENQTYFWRARANDGSLYSSWIPTASFMVNTANDAPGAPQLSAPAEGTTLSTLTPALEVVNALDPDSAGLTYDFEVYSNNLLITSISGISEGISAKTAATLGSALADNTLYSWRARAFDGDRYGQWMNMATFTTHIMQSTIKAEIEFDPETLNRKSEGKWVKVEIELPHGYKAADIDISSIRLEGTVPAQASPVSISHGEDADELTVKFRRDSVIAVLPQGEHVPVHVTGKVGSVMFEGVDIIRVIK